MHYWSPALLNAQDVIQVAYRQSTSPDTPPVHISTSAYYHPESDVLYRLKRLMHVLLCPIEKPLPCRWIRSNTHISCYCECYQTSSHRAGHKRHHAPAA